jgi:hypothetical protein
MKKILFNLSNKFIYMKICIVLLFFLIYNNDMQGRVYKLIEGEWFNFSSGKKGDQIVPERLIVRLSSRNSLKSYNFSELGLQNITVISNKLLGDYYGLAILGSQDPFNVATILSNCSDFDYIEFDAWGETLSVPNDNYYPSQWNMSKIEMPSA